MKNFSTNTLGAFYFSLLNKYKRKLRLDVLNFVTLVHAFRKNALNVWVNDEGKITFKLESLAKANCFESDSSKAIADVETTMKLLQMLLKIIMTSLKYSSIIRIL